MHHLLEPFGYKHEDLPNWRKDMEELERVDAEFEKTIYPAHYDEAARG